MGALSLLRMLHLWPEERPQSSWFTTLFISLSFTHVQQFSGGERHRRLLDRNSSLSALSSQRKRPLDCRSANRSDTPHSDTPALFCTPSTAPLIHTFVETPSFSQKTPFLLLGLTAEQLSCLRYGRSGRWRASKSSPLLSQLRSPVASRSPWSPMSRMPIWYRWNCKYPLQHWTLELSSRASSSYSHGRILKYFRLTSAMILETIKSSSTTMS